MSERTFEIPTADSIRAVDDHHWRDALASLDTPVLDEGEVAYVMPYFAAFRAYEKHVRDCTACAESPVWDIGCEQGARLASISADAMAAQDDLAVQN